MSPLFSVGHWNELTISQVFDFGLPLHPCSKTPFGAGLHCYIHRLFAQTARCFLVVDLPDVSLPDCSAPPLRALSSGATSRQCALFHLSPLFFLTSAGVSV